MCIGWPMRVQSVRPGFATVRRAAAGAQVEEREVRTALVDPVAPGDWLLVFLDDAREQLSPERAAEISATLGLVEAALSGGEGEEAGAAGHLRDTLAAAPAAFDLPSRWTPEQLEAFR